VGGTLGYFKIIKLPTGVDVASLSLITSLLVFFAVSWITRRNAASELDADIQLVMEA
jgi:hypothetical protein